MKKTLINETWELMLPEHKKINWDHIEYERLKKMYEVIKSCRI